HGGNLPGQRSRLVDQVLGVPLIQRRTAELRLLQYLQDLSGQRVPGGGERGELRLDRLVGLVVAGDRGGGDLQGVHRERPERGVDLLERRTEPQQRLVVRPPGL